MSGGYDRDFLRARLELSSPSATTTLLDYIHFSVRFRVSRKLAAIVGVNINGKELNPLAREGTWHFDDRIPREQQAGPDVYKNNAFDRGHLVRRLDPVWGDPATAKKANQDTFVFTNAAPQVDDFNQGKELWVGLEDHVLEHADAYDAKGERIKQFDPKEFEKVQGEYQLQEMEIRSRKSGSRTSIEFELSPAKR